MALETNKQIEKLINQSSHILIAFRKDYTTDSVASAVGLYLFTKLGQG